MPPKKGSKKQVRQPSAPVVDPVFKRGDGYERARADLVQAREGSRWTLRERAGGAFVTDAAEPFAGVEIVGVAAR